MLEKDIENLLARHPDEFFPRQRLRLKGQQVKLGTYYADIVFENEVGDSVVVEVKRGLLLRDAVGQIIDYYGMLRRIEPSKKVLLILAANVIPKERTTFLREQLGIKCVEIPVSKIRKVAEKYSYQFLDSEKPELLQEHAETTRKFDRRVHSGETKAWIFQANPQRFDILNALADETNEDTWLVNQYQNYIRAGHVAIVWMSGKEGGIYALGDVISDPAYMIDSEATAKYWTSDADRGQRRLRARIKYRLKLVNNPVMKDELRNIPLLRNLSIFRNARGTNFPVSNAEWEIISNLVKQRFA